MNKLEHADIINMWSEVVVLKYNNVLNVCIVTDNYK